MFLCSAAMTKEHSKWQSLLFTSQTLPTLPAQIVPGRNAFLLCSTTENGRFVTSQTVEYPKAGSNICRSPNAQLYRRVLLEHCFADCLQKAVMETRSLVLYRIYRWGQRVSERPFVPSNRIPGSGLHPGLLTALPGHGPPSVPPGWTFSTESGSSGVLLTSDPLLREFFFFLKICIFPFWEIPVSFLGFRLTFY